MFKKVESDKVVAPSNYTPQMIEVIKEYAPVTYEKAKIIAGLINRTPKSVVSKCKEQGIEYISKPAPAKKAVTRTKSETVKLIESETGCSLDGLVVAPVAVLNKLLALFIAANDEVVEMLLDTEEHESDEGEEVYTLGIVESVAAETDTDEG